MGPPIEAIEVPEEQHETQLDPSGALRIWAELAWDHTTAEHHHVLTAMRNGTFYRFTVTDEATRYSLSARPLVLPPNGYALLQTPAPYDGQHISASPTLPDIPP
ncbi:hypothetical protein RB200_37775 [Streptomyces sp. PmtG]